MTRAEREQQLLDVAEEIFGRQGYADTTMEDVAARAGITKPVIYDHFGSKERLLSAVVERARDVLFTSLVATFDALPRGSTTEDYFRAGSRTFMEFFDGHRDSFRAYLQQGAIAAAAGGDIEALRRFQAGLIAEQLSRIPALREVPLPVREGIAEIIISANERAAGWALRNEAITTELATELTTTVLWGGVSSLLEGEGVPRLSALAGSGSGGAQGDPVEDVVLARHADDPR